MIIPSRKVWLVEGEHHAVPGRITELCATAAGADREAAIMVELLIGDGKRVADSDWREALKRYEAAREGFDCGYVEVVEKELRK